MGISHLKKHDLADTLFEILEGWGTWINLEYILDICVLSVIWSVCVSGFFCSF